MKKKKTANIVMVIIIAALVVCCVLAVGKIRGWFDRDTGESAVLTSIRGIVTMERDSAAYDADSDTVLREGDRITNGMGATSAIRIGENEIALGENAVVVIEDPSVETFRASITAGEAFVNTAETLTIGLAERTVEFTDAVAIVSVREGAQSVSILDGSVEGEEQGRLIDWVNGTKYVRELNIDSLNDFAIERIMAVNDARPLYFSNEQIETLLEERQAERQAMLMRAAEEETAETEESESESASEAASESAQESTAPGESAAPGESSGDNAGHRDETDAASGGSGSGGNSGSGSRSGGSGSGSGGSSSGSGGNSGSGSRSGGSGSGSGGSGSGSDSGGGSHSGGSDSGSGGNTDPTTPAETEPAETPAPEPVHTCTIEIVCWTILNNMGNLDPAKAGFVPGSGVILPATTVQYTPGETVFDVLTRVCSVYGIQIEYSWTPMYNSYYIEGINNLYEFDCGPESGWMYKVNGWFPNYGCSGYTLSDGDAITWTYTCNGLGADVGGGYAN